MNEASDGIAPWLPGLLVGSCLFLGWLIIAPLIGQMLPEAARIVAWSVAAGAIVLLFRKIDPVAARLEWPVAASPADLARLLIPCLFVLWGSTWLLASISDPSVFDTWEAPASGAMTWIAPFLFVVILAPIVEEVFFRGLVQRGVGVYVRPAAAILVAAVVFAAVHARGGPMIFDPFIAGLLFGYVVHTSASLWAARNSQPQALVGIPTQQVRVVIAEAAVLDSLPQGTLAPRSERDPTPISPYWDAFRERFSGATALITFARPGYSSDGSLAVLDVTYGCGPLCGGAYVVVGEWGRRMGDTVRASNDGFMTRQVWA